VTLPPGIQEAVLNARRAHSRFGQFFDDIDKLRWHVHQIPTECDELRRRCWNLGLPGDFDVMQITWRPDYDPCYYEQLSKRSRTMYLFREEYIFDLEKCVVVEVPRAGHATYVFAKPVRLDEFVWQYAKSTRQDILANRNNIAENLEPPRQQDPEQIPTERHVSSRGSGRRRRGKSPLMACETFSQICGRKASPHRASTSAGPSFGHAMIGLYGVMSYAVTRRTREFEFG
jgi:hypothetical protein